MITSTIVFLWDDVRIMGPDIKECADASSVADILISSAISCNDLILKSLGYKTDAEASARLSRSKVMDLTLNMLLTTSLLMAVQEVGFSDDVE